MAHVGREAVDDAVRVELNASVALQHLARAVFTVASVETDHLAFSCLWIDEHHGSNVSNIGQRDSEEGPRADFTPHKLGIKDVVVAISFEFKDTICCCELGVRRVVYELNAVC